DAARGLLNFALPLFGPARHPRRYTDSQPQPCRDGKPDRFLCQHTDLPHSILRADDISRITGPGARGGIRGLRASRLAFREAGRRVATGKEPQSLTRFPGDARSTKRPDARSGAARAAPDASALR